MEGLVRRYYGYEKANNITTGFNDESQTANTKQHINN